MKKLLFCLMFLTAQAFAQEDLGKAFQREFSYLAAQKAALVKDQNISKQQHATMMSNLENEVKSLERQLVKSSAQNDSLAETIQQLEKEKRENASREMSFSSTYKKALKLLADLEQNLHLEVPQKTEPNVPANLSILNYEKIKDHSLSLLKRSVEISEFRGTYRNAEGELVDGPILRYGQIAAHALDGSKRKVLGPNGEGLVAELEVITAGNSILPFYLFDNLSDKAVLKKRSSVTDKMADMMPLLILGIMLTLVLSLFVMFARE